MFIQSSLLGDPFLTRALRGSVLQPQIGRVFVNGSPERSKGNSVRVNVAEHGDQVEIEALIPGFNMEELAIEIVGQQLSIHAKNSSEKKHEGGKLQERGYHQREFSLLAEVNREVELPFEVEPDKVEARYVGGILYITASRAESAKPKKIPVKAS